MSSSQGHHMHFFKVIMETALQTGKMKLPTSFVRRHWEGMSNPVVLSLPNGTKNRMYWLLDPHGDVWFCNGWKQFAEYCKLEVSNFMVFRYQGNSSFSVIIFGKDGSEIKYPSTTDATGEKVKEIDKDSDFSAKLSEEPSKRRKQVPEEEELNKHSKKRVSSDYSKQMNGAGNNSKGDFKRKLRMFHEKVKKMFNSEHEHFTCLIQKTYTERDLMIIPGEFSKPYLHRKGTATLFFGYGRTWEVETKLDSYGQLIFFTGWRKFVLDNKLKIGDVCAFELLDREQFLFNVTLYPLQEDSSTPLFKGRKRVSDTPSSSSRTPVTPKARTPKLR